MNAKLTSYATYSDLVGYIKCRDGGGSADYCLNKGDNGVGASGKTTAQIRTPMVAIPSAEMKKKWGSTSAAWGKMIEVTCGNRRATAQCADIGPTGVCDLNPAMLIAMGWPEDKELSVQGTWKWVD